ncbi:MAG: BamA/TamA family outer membrane protein [Phycisphaerae bacterium]|nr:BamA/TamA family outer membrane protein [Phycisphaerae bacterium]
MGLFASEVMPFCRVLTLVVVWGGLFSALSPAEAQEAGKPLLPPAQQLLDDADRLSNMPKVFVKGFRFEGNSDAVFTDAQLLDVLSDYVDQDLTHTQLMEARRLLTQHYVSAGYINSGAVLPDQKVADGIITFKIVEGRLGKIDLTGANRLREDRLKRQIARGAGEPLNVVSLRETMELLRLGPNLERVNAQLKPGADPGESLLDVEIEESDPLQVAVRFSNDRSPSVGSEQVKLLVTHQNVSGLGDSLSFQYGIINNGVEDAEFAEDDDISLQYVRPINDADTTLILGFARTSTLLIEDTFVGLDIDSESQTLTVGLRHPVRRTLNSEFALSLTGEVKSNETSLLGTPFSFSPGAVNGESNVTALRFGQEWTNRNQSRVIAARSTFNFGLQILDATEHGSLPDSGFFAWVGQVQYLRRLGESSNQLVLRVNTQLANDALLSLEQFAIGGVNTVRGYRENEIVRDNGAVASAELRLPLILTDSGKPVLQLAPFLDFGYGWNTHTPHREADIGSGGLGLLLNVDDRVNLQTYWGMPFRNFSNPDHDLQDEGFHFNVVVNLR